MRQLASQWARHTHAAILPHATDPDGLKTLKFLATKWHIAFSAMTVLGLLLSTLM